MNRALKIHDIEISDDSPVFVIAEIGHNHQGNVETCERLFWEAAKSGVSAVKLQKRNNKELYTKTFFDSPYEGPTSFGATYGLHRESLEFCLDDYRHLKNYAEKLGVIFFATAFDLSSLEFLVQLGVPAIKIASGDLRSIPLIKKAASTNIPLILSTGGGTWNDIEVAMSYVNPKNSALLQCTAAYPAEADLMDLNVITSLRDVFPNTVIGLSSHDKGILFPVIAATLGARIVEKHFTLDRTMKGTDHAFSLEPVGMRKMVRDLDLGVRALGSSQKRRFPEEAPGIRKMGKMMVWGHDLLAGSTVSEDDISMKSPMDGLSPQMLNQIIGRKLRRSVVAENPVSLDDFE